MRLPPEIVQRPRPRRRTIVLLGVLALVIILLVLAQGAAGFYANFLWFHWSGVGAVWRAETLTKINLAVVFFLAAGLFVFASLFLVDRVVSRSLFLSTDTELVRRYRAVAGTHPLALRSVVAVLVGLVLGPGVSAQWQHWILFEHPVPFGVSDPVFHRDASFFVFRLPFLSFLVDWLFGLLVVAFVVTAVAYFLNGAIRLHGGAHIEPRAVGHLSLILSLIALERAWAYYYIDRFTLDLSHNGVVAGAGYTDVHVRLPAMTLLAVVSLIAFVVLAFNVYQRTWVLPAAAIGLWIFLAIVVGAIFPAVVQAVSVTPAQSRDEAPYIARNIVATRNAMGLTHVVTHTFPANQDLTPGVLQSYEPTLSDTQVWDPTYALSTFQKLQHVLAYYRLSNLTIDRYRIGGKLEPVVIGVRTLSSSGLPAQAQTWVNLHLQYTHGYGAVVAAANAATSNGSPQFLLKGVPATSSVSSLLPSGRAEQVYFAPGESQYVVVDTSQPEVDYELQNGTNSLGHYSGSGGIPVGSVLSRLAFAVHLRDFNLLISNLITSKSRLIYIPDVRAEVQRALPFLSVDANPYPVIDNGQLVWMLDAYTTSAAYPYGQPADTVDLPPGSGLAGSYNYVRDALKVVVNAYTGKMSFYAIDPAGDPIIRAYEQAFPGLIQPLSKMDATLLAHLRYPQDLLTIQAEAYGRYHITNTADFYSLSAAWDLSQTSTSTNGSPSAPLPLAADGSVQRFSPIYELLQLGNEQSLSFSLVEPFVPYSSDDKLQTLAGLMLAESNSADYGGLSALVTPSGTAIDGPGLANSVINSDPTISKQLTLLDQGGSTVSFGTVQILPIADSLIYVRPLYVSSSQSSFPQLADVVVVYGQQVAMAPTLDAALAGVFGASVNGNNNGVIIGSGGTTLPAEVRSLITQATADYNAAQAALADGDLGTYQADVTSAGQLLTEANRDLQAATAAKAPARASTKSAGATRPGIAPAPSAPTTTSVNA